MRSLVSIVPRLKSKPKSMRKPLPVPRLLGIQMYSLNEGIPGRKTLPIQVREETVWCAGGEMTPVRKAG